MKLHWMNYWMLFHTFVFWILVFVSLLRLESLLVIEWDTIIQLWIWNIFAYLYVAFMNFMRDVKNKNLESPLMALN